ncbi:hypothetical protein A2763_02055 [Candidatus Kaiserbacteria bacterium RIFCSPHIGHO2_01_FULL_54_36]|uniref:GtrA-like protein domain-containing protein n=1 Tax=Candidatus Kaiserbacteria bacterium RIFCSPHIGHO2_01_FULL_54_36 TaxID=1798482 RepID=A0A1F6CQF7_9BACT|nr:MAG: hypothetical protein A2763_02055 [Candidatus Kaiserbacteria bacterium RIFCSPHIGHO2_01_FULL_54_36]OGG75892.1 MAG: hypothetical protein A3A41_04525 [Candidatus Kaiserbacteria bacterium RIFCSPLOWO2_01_FULL_54_22]
MRALYRSLSSSHPTQMRIVRFLISGSSAAGINLGTLFVLTHFFDVWYLLSSVVAFSVSFFVSFTLQKFWTFNDASLHRVRSQAFVYLMIALADLGLNTLLLFVLVEYAHVHYMAAQLLCMGLIAIINFFSYKRFVFRALKNDAPLSATQTRTRMSPPHIFFLVVAFVLFASLASYRLSENPPTWIDEGTITQTSINLAAHGIYGMQTAPGHFITTAGFITTSFPVTYPIALSFSLFGTTLLNARGTMVLFMTLLCALSYFLIRSLAGERKGSISLFSLFLLVTFAPLYGHGKNVLGEVPGLMYFVASLVFLQWAEKKSYLSLWVFSGVFAGLAMTTKPSYLIFIAPSLLVVAYLRRKQLSWRSVLTFCAGAGCVLLWWFFVHVTSIAALKEIFLVTNPNDHALSARLINNSARFISELQPLYFLGLLSLWWGSLLFRTWRKVEIPTVELFAGIFSAVSLLLYLPSGGFYRYFFPAEALALVFLPLALYRTPLAERYRSFFLKAATVFLLLLILFQGYQTLFHSWVSEHQENTRSALLSLHLRDIGDDKKIFLYNVPEAVIFLNSHNYYQYLQYGEVVTHGAENLAFLFRGEPDYVLVDTEFPDTERVSAFYSERSRFDKYVLYEKTRK